MYEEEYWNIFINSGNVFDYLAYRIENEQKHEMDVVQVGVDTNGAVNCINRNNFIYDTYR